MKLFTGRQVNRIDPKLPPQSMKTYQIVAPISTHTRPATCEEVLCQNYRNGFKILTDPNTDLGQAQATYLRADRSRTWRSVNEGGLIVFYAPPGSQCFAEHRAPLDREPFYLRREGDYRGNPRGTEPFKHTTPESWVDDFASHQAALADKLNGSQ